MIFGNFQEICLKIFGSIATEYNQSNEETDRHEKIDSQRIVLYKIVDNADVGQYLAISGERKGIATYCKKNRELFL